MKLFLMGMAILGLMGGVFSAAADVAAEPVYTPGETIHYQIKKMGIKVGDAVFKYHGPVEDSGRQLILLNFTADGFNFYDEEKIYADPQTLLPVRVERDLNIFGKKEKIIEYYDQADGKIRVVKTRKDGTVEEQILKKEGAVDNLYCFIYRYRAQGAFHVGEVLHLKLPTKDVELKIVRKADIKVDAQIRDSFFMESVGGEYRVWFGSDAERAPLRIDGAIGFAKTQMILVEYEFGAGATSH